ncbi:L,D-transpeptidase family protein [Xanthobacter autotrophicus DSM 597]|uniref:L,D-transpeptidase family protein n=1 Tax=Xanthobacter TaxID=279 RepID=UPI001DF5FF2B|nr:L,D-transpeptidase [Xanthobacter flavus]MBP2150469.1 lipoprotein-anchoring transpeptidase ErfK/SrfK [Xanthobacter flavus]
MTLRNTLLLAAVGASVLAAPAFAQGQYGGPNYSLPGAQQDDATGTLPPAPVGGYGEAPPGYSDPYSRQQAPVRRDQVERTDLPAPGQPYPQQAYPQPAQQGYPQPAPGGYARGPVAVTPDAGPYPGAVPAQGQQAYGGQPVYNAAPDLYGRQATPTAYEPAQPAYGQQPGYGGSGRGAVDQDALYASLNTAPAPAGTYGPNSAVVPGTTEAPSGPRIENVDPTEPVPERFRRQTVDYVTTQPAGTIVIDTPNTYLYLVLGGGKAIRYGIGVGREGFTWAGTEKITAKKEWADWRPPSEMIERQPYLPRFMAGGPGNPLGARTMYLGGTIYRIHGTNEPQTIGKFVSSGCFRMLNADVEDLYDRAKVGTKVVILPKANSAPQANAAPVSTASTGKPAQR